MARKKVRTQFLLLKKKSHGKAKNKNFILTFSKKKNSKGKEKGKNAILTFGKNQMLIKR